MSKIELKASKSKSVDSTSMEYALPALHLNETQCKAIMAPVLKAGLPKSGYNRNFPLDQYLIFVEVFIICFLHRSLNKCWFLCAMACVTPLLASYYEAGTMETLKLELGIPGKIFDQDFKKVGQLATVIAG
jgi:hypothetical protein